MQDAAAEEIDPVFKRRQIRALLPRLQEMLSKRPFLKNVSIMLSGSAGGQVISLLLSPVLTRLYSPQEFGILSVYSAILAIVVAVASLRYEMALPLVRSEQDSINLLAVCLGSLVLTTAVLGCALFAIPAPFLTHLLSLPPASASLATYLGLLIVGYFCLGGYYVALFGATRAGAFPAIAKTRMAQGVVGPLSQIGLALFGAGAPGLLSGSILGQSAGTFGLLYSLIPDRRTVLSALSWQRMADLARRYRRFPLIGTWAALVDSIGGGQLLYLLVTVHYSARIAGFIFLAERVVARPLMIVGSSILQVFVGEAGQTVSTDPAKLKSRFIEVVLRQLALAAAWTTLATLAGTILFPIVFGAEWADGVVYLQAISLAFLAQAVVQPVFHTLQILEKQAMAAVWQVGRLLLTVGLFEVGIRLGVGAPWVIAGYSAAQVVSCALLLWLMSYAIQQRQR